MRIKTPVCIFAFVGIAMSGCGRSDVEYQRQLPNGYRVQSDGDDRPMICAPTNIVIIPPMSHQMWQVRSIQVTGDLVIGNIELKSTGDLSWFILDTQTGERHVYIDEVEWRQEAEGRKIQTIVLVPPHTL
jgi:hypothetical protein